MAEHFVGDLGFDPAGFIVGDQEKSAEEAAMLAEIERNRDAQILANQLGVSTALGRAMLEQMSR